MTECHGSKQNYHLPLPTSDLLNDLLILYGFTTHKFIFEHLKCDVETTVKHSWNLPANIYQILPLHINKPPEYNDYSPQILLMIMDIADDQDILVRFGEITSIKA